MDSGFYIWVPLFFTLAYFLFAGDVFRSFSRGSNDYQISSHGLIPLGASTVGMALLPFGYQGGNLALLISVIGILSCVLLLFLEGGWDPLGVSEKPSDSNLDNTDAVIVLLGIMGTFTIIAPNVAFAIILLRRRYMSDGKTYFLDKKSAGQSKTEIALSLSGVQTANDAFIIIAKAMQNKGINLEEAFEEMDADDNGRIDRTEFTTGLQNLIGHEIVPLTAYTILKAIDLDDDDSIDIEEFSIALNGINLEDDEELVDSEESANSEKWPIPQIKADISLSSLMATCSIILTLGLLFYSLAVLSVWVDAVEESTTLRCVEQSPALNMDTCRFDANWNLFTGDFTTGHDMYGNEEGRTKWSSNFLSTGPSSMYGGYFSISPIGIDGPYPWLILLVVSIGALALQFGFISRISQVHNAESERRKDEIRFMQTIALNPNALVDGEIEPLLPVLPKRSNNKWSIFLLILLIFFLIFSLSTLVDFQYHDKINQRIPEWNMDDGGIRLLGPIPGSFTVGHIPMEGYATISGALSGIFIEIICVAVMGFFACAPMFVTVRDNDNSSEALNFVSPTSTSTSKPEIPSISELGGEYLAPDESLRIDKVLEMLENEILAAREEAESLKIELKETKEQVEILENNIVEKDVQLEEMSNVRDEVESISKKIQEEGGNANFNLHDSALSGDVYSGSTRIDTQIINNPSDIAKAVIEAYKTGKKERSVDDN